ncbi:hypothetical protein [Rhodococcus baikonurensis]|uniref:DUF222 domain-containing protein n=1 Tax=Rhodococcus baikonurensis TaxID=172041 RepID=A0ABV5XKB4_9NOCA
MSTDTARPSADHAIDTVAVRHLAAAIRTEGLSHTFSVQLEQLKRAYTAQAPTPDSVREATALTVIRNFHAHAIAEQHTPDSDIVNIVAELSVASLPGAQRLALAQLLIASVAVSEEVSKTTSGTMIGCDPREADTSKSSRLAGARESILDALDVVDSKGVARILAPTSEAPRSVAQKRRKAGELIGLPIGARPNYRYPVFQFDTERHKIHDVVRHANLRLHVENDPYGAASWWMTTTELLDGNSPLEDLEAGQLTEIAVDNVLDYARRGM